MINDWLSDENGLLPKRNQGAVNQIVFLVEYLYAKKLKESLNVGDMNWYDLHIKSTNDENGLYTLKNSHDNLTMKMCGSILLGRQDHLKMDLRVAMKGANYHPKDTILYMIGMSQNKLVNAIGHLFAWIPCIAIIVSALSRGKVRPKWFNTDDRNQARFWFYFRRRKFLGEEPRRDGITKVYEMSNGQIFRMHYMQNDGKILSAFKILAFQNNPFIKITGKIYDFIMRRKHGKFYMFELFKNYFEEEDHPVRVEWKNLELKL